MANTFVKAMGGQYRFQPGGGGPAGHRTHHHRKGQGKGVKLHIPTDAVVADAFAENANTDQCAADAVPDGWMALDIGPDSIKAFRIAILGSRTILWNGPWACSR
jgi:phosphoglycerate kinase